MTKLYRLLGALLLAVTSHATLAQSPDSLRQAIDYLFAPVDKSQVPVPYLYEYGNQFASPLSFNGTLSNGSVVTLPVWRMLYASVVGGNVGRPSPLPPLPDLNAALAAQVAATPDAIPLVVQCLDYASLRPDARSANLLSYSGGQLRDVPGRAASPYELRKLFAVAPAQPVSATGRVSFVFRPDLHVAAGGVGGSGVQAIQLDFGDGRGYLPVSWNVPIGTQYCAAGTQRIKVRITYGSSQSDPNPEPRPAPKTASRLGVAYESWFDLYVQEGGCNSTRYDGSDAPQLAQPFYATSEHSGGMVYVRFGGNRNPGDQTIRRPLIVAEGYDGYSAAPAVYPGNYTIGDFIRALASTSFTQSSFYNSLETAVDELGNPSGYDIVFIDYNNGTDDIRRNAALFEEVVRWVNATKLGGRTAGAENVVLGISMGGLVARYGLAEMVKNPRLENGVNVNNPHTRLLVTHDSPHRGANTPLGVQMLVRQAAGSLAGTVVRWYNGAVNSAPQFFSVLAIRPELEQADNILDAPATRQLLLVRGKRLGFGGLASYSSEYNSFVDNEYRSMITPGSGQSFPYRFIASSLGSQCGTGLFAPHTELVRVERSGYAGLVGTTLGYGLQTVLNALPSPGQVQRVSTLRLWVDTKVLGISLPRFYLTNRSFHSPADNPAAWDGLAGGTQPINGQLQGLTPGGSYPAHIAVIFAWGSGSNTQLVPNFCFVPRASALDVLTLDNASLTAPYVNALAGGSPSRAEKFIAQQRYFSGGQQYNWEHPLFPARQAEWIVNELQAPYTNNTNPLACEATPECTPQLSNTTITGPTTLCVNRSSNPGATATYTSPLQAPGYTYSWTASSPNNPPCAAFTVCTGTNPTFQTANVPGINDDEGTITLEVSTPCQTFTFTKDVVIGKPQALAIQLDEQDDCHSIAYFSFPNYDPTLTYTKTNGVGPISARFWVKAASFTITAATVSCGSTSYSGTVAFNSCRTYEVYPNPASDQVTVAQVDSTNARPASQRGSASAGTNNATGSSASFTVRLYDSYGTLRHTAVATGPQVQLPTGTLPAGLYVLTILEAGSNLVERRQVEIIR